MSQKATQEYIERTRERYGGMRTKQARTATLDAFCETTDYTRKHAIKLLNGQAGNRQRPPGRPAVYNADVGKVLEKMWLMSDQLCGKLLKPVLPAYIRSHEKHHGRLSSTVKRKLRTISAATIDRLLRDKKVETPKWRRRPRSAEALKRQVPVRTGPWEVKEPGWLEADAVAHCGGSLAGSFVWSVTYTDIHTQWTENRAVWNRGSQQVLERTRQVENALPFPILGFDVDNGSEFLNWHLHGYMRDREVPVHFTRSRPYQKNDNAHVEQKNSTHVRQLLGHDRFEDPDMVELINELYVNEWRLFRNLFCPNMKLLEKTRVGSRYRKHFDSPRTPAERLLESKKVCDLQKQRVRGMLRRNDPYTLRLAIEQKLKKIFGYEQNTTRARAS